MTSGTSPTRVEPRTPQPAERTPTVILDRITKRFPVRRGWAETLRHPRRTVYTPVVREVSCEIAEGEFFGLLGPNGAGKTTLFKMLATLTIPDEGTAVIAGHDVVREPEAVRRVLAPVVADERSLYWRLTAADNLELYGVLQGLGRSASRDRARELLIAVGLDNVGTKIVGSFSSGMKQRLLIARALIARPQVLLLDEPTRSLDPISARAFRKFLREEIVGVQRCTVLLATHNAEETLELCTRVGILDHGYLLATGTTEELAREIGEDQYQLWTRAPLHPAVAALTQRGIAQRFTAGEPDDAGWIRVELDVPGGLDRAAQVTAFLIEQGVVIARFERAQFSLADLIDRIVKRGRGSVGGDYA